MPLISTWRGHAIRHGPDQKRHHVQERMLYRLLLMMTNNKHFMYQNNSFSRGSLIFSDVIIKKNVYPLNKNSIKESPIENKHKMKYMEKFI